MSAEPVRAEEQDKEVQEMVRLVRALSAHEPAELAGLLRGRRLGQDARRAIEAIAALQIVDKPLQAGELFPLLGAGGGGVEAVPADVVAGNMVVQIKHAGAARKVSVSMPENLTTAVQQRVGRGKFSQYVTEAVARQFELDLLAELSELLTSEHGPVPEEYLEEARAAWPDGE
jgi:hypothetical protein